jgi:hypothetical protein
MLAALVDMLAQKSGPRQTTDALATLEQTLLQKCATIAVTNTPSSCC